MAQEPPSPSPSLALLPSLPGRNRRGSLGSVSNIDKDVLAEALDHIHTSASKSETLTSFHDYDPAAPRAGAKELVSSGISGLFDRVKRGWDSPSKGSKRVSQASDFKASIGPGSLLDATSPASRAAAGPIANKRRSIDTASFLSNTSATTPSLTARATTPASASQNRKAPRDLEDSKQAPSTAANINAGDSDEGGGADDMPPSGHPAPSFSLDELSRERHANADEVHRESASQALARVLSQNESQRSQDRLRPRKPESQAIDRRSGNDSMLTGVEHLPPSMGGAKAAPAASRQSSDTSTLEHTVSRPPLVQVGASHLPGYAPSRTSSAIDSLDAASVSSLHHESIRSGLDPSPDLKSSLQQRAAGSGVRYQQSYSVQTVPQHLKRRVISKGFWMKDENAKDCFSCGQSFSTFRRKHHCRTCGQIFDAKCTILVPGKPFGLSGSLRLCNPCESMVFGSDEDDSSAYTTDEEYPVNPTLRRSLTQDDSMQRSKANGQDRFVQSTHEIATPSLGIPVSRRNREAKQRSNILEFDGTPILARPSSSHSLISLARRPRSSSHRRHYSRQQVLRGRGLSIEDHGPFHPDSLLRRDRASVNFHNDAFIDPDLAPFASDDGSDAESQSHILSAMADMQNLSPGDRDRSVLIGHSSSSKRGRSRLGTMSSSRGQRDEDPSGHGTKTAVKLSRARNVSSGSMAISQTPLREAESVSKLNLSPDFDTKCPQLNSPLPSTGENGLKSVRSAAMCGRDAPSVELNQASLEHVRKLLRQLLQDSHIDRVGTWAKALLPILLQCTDDVEPSVQLGDDMDIRDYIKLKKVPGGRPGDTSYVSGVVFSKNVALKSMARSIYRPRIAIVTFALEYARHQAHFMSLEPVIAQEQEYLRNLVGRIAALRPHVLLVQRHVSGLALDLLQKAGITVAYNIKESVLAAVARVTQATMIKSVDKLAMGRSHLGQCESFEVKTYMSDNRRKTFIFLSGCPPDLGCTIVLRGEDTRILRKVKRITEFMCYVAYNLKLETSLMRDESISIPSHLENNLKAPDSPSLALRERINPNHGHGESLGDPQAQAASDGEIPSQYEKMEEEMRSRILSVSPFVVFMQPYILTQLRESERRLITYKRLRDQYAAADEEGDDLQAQEKGIEHADHFSIVKPEMVHVPASRDQPKALREYLHAVHEAQFEKTLYTYETQRRVFDSFMSGASNPFDPYSHQIIVLLHSMISTINSAPCVGPELLYIGFYAGYNHADADFEEDCTLGQFVEDCCLSANNMCKDCGKRMLDHHRQYVHGFGQVSISVQSQPAKLHGYNKTILMWATCRICKQETSVSPMSDNTWRYSFAKYLELCFWSTPLHLRAGGCSHDIHKNFIRCFGFENLVMQVQYDPVDIYDVVVPRAMITWKVESDLKTKNEQFLRFVSRLNAFTDSVKKRLDSINVDTLDEKKAAEAHDLLSELHDRADQDHMELLKKLQDKYSRSRYYELIPLNRALRLMDQKAIAWDEVFTDFERDYFPSETDIRKLATLQLRNMFLESQPPPSMTTSDTSDTEDVSIDMAGLSLRGLSQRFRVEELQLEKAQSALDGTKNHHPQSSLDDRDSLGEDQACPGEDHQRFDLLSPLPQDHEHVVERDEVKHLDLAIATVGTDDNPRPTEAGGVLSSSPSDTHAYGTLSDHEDLSNEPRPLASGLLERIEQIRSSSDPMNAEQGQSDSKIPRLTGLRRLSHGSRRSPPPLLRAKSQPTHVVRRSVDIVAPINAEPHTGDSSKIDDRHGEKRLADRLGRLTIKVGKVAPSLIPRSIPARQEDPNSTSVSALAKHFEQLSREFEKERLKERRQRALRSRQARAEPFASSQPVVEVYLNATDAVGDRNLEQVKQDPSPDEGRSKATRPDPAIFTPLQSSDELQSEQAMVKPSDDHDNSSPEHARDRSPEALDAASSEPSGGQAPDQIDLVSGASSTSLLSPADLSNLEIPADLSIPEHKKNVWFKYLAEFWSKRSASGWASLEYPLRTTEHVFEDSDIIVREDEPSSVIALSLACDDYKIKVQEFRSHPKIHTNSGGADPQSIEGDYSDTYAQQNAIEASLLSDTGTHMKYSFSHGQVKASCKIFYAESFDALRRKCGIADRFVESLSRCLKYDSKGGKTKSLFLKTMDNRFIVKSLQEVELKAFTKFAPDYFAFMSHTLFHGVPSVIAKMLGLFQVTIKNPLTGMDFSYYLLVMENLFYEQNPNRRFDLKGSMRNRKIESTGQPDEVLLDENLVETIFESPLFIREHARKLLQASVWNDTMWLCKQNVMDYSLMAGFDDERKELVVGIIDCIRTYTWDKKLESWIKDRGKNKPTITSPKDYRNRFRVSMMQYMLIAPTVWHQFQAQMAAPKTLKEKEDDGGITEPDKSERKRRSEGKAT